MEMKPIPGFEPYMATDDGRIYSPKSGVFMQASIDRDGYEHVSLRLARSRHINPKRISVHRAVALAFHGPPATEGMQVCHGDGDRRNNTPGNLRWGSRQDNGMDTRRHGSQRGENNPRARLTRPAVEAIRSQAASGFSPVAIAKAYGVPLPTVYHVIHRRTWA